MQFHQRMQRATKENNIRYYEIEISKNLFGDYFIERTYGSIKYKSFTGKRVNYFSSKDEALLFFEKIVKLKEKRGYKIHLD
ncbi:WGR domain-containing protein [Campylobacter jejuni]|uniref:WGR domain-containing protein n=1 Tax=Campylobacter jejuni TaxID=197 RepID=UPI000B1EFBFD|nr:WGR domain-containing protein [Campylobacter jejuni]